MKNLLHPYNPAWKTGFENLERLLVEALKEFEINIQHIGSTAIPGLHAKPILDIDIITGKKEQLSGITAVLERLGYNNKGEQGIAGRYAFRQSSAFTPAANNLTKWQEHHLYVCFADSTALKNHLLFRDILLQDKALVNEYAQLKINLANEKGMTRERYTQQKTGFILKVLSMHGMDEKALFEIRKANR